MNTNLNTNTKAAAESDLEPRGDVAVSIKLFHDAMHSIADRATARPVPADWLIPARRRQRSTQRRMILAWSCAAALCFAAVPLSFRTMSPGNVDPQVTAKMPVEPAVKAPSPASEDAFLEQVDSEISEPVPSSLAPLTELDSWNSTTNESSIHTEKKNVTQ
jgi:hypothetical protein